MPFTDFPNGVTSFGVVLPASPSYPMNGKKHWFVHGNLGNDGLEGTSPANAFKTMARAFTFVGSGDVIHLIGGNIKEQLSTPVGVFDVTIVGESNLPRNADAHTGNNGYSSVTWKAPTAPTATTPLLKILQQGWKIINILFNPPADAAAITLFRNDGAGDAERDASHANIINCRFQGGQDHINIVECAFVRIEGCSFGGATGTAIKSTAGSGVALPYKPYIINNWLHDNVNAIILAANYGLIRWNVIGKFTTKGLDLSGGAGQYNIITANNLGGTYSIVGGYIKANANDNWGGNWNTGVGILTTVVPA